MQVKIVKADIKIFRKYQSAIMDIYIEAGTSGVMEQHLEKDAEAAYLTDLLQSGGYGYVVLDGSRLIGFILAEPLADDPLLPDTIRRQFPVERCLYIAEMHVHKDYREQGIGTELMTRFIEEADRKKWEYLFIRAWKNNVRAIRLYQRLGFQLAAIINQTKIRKDRSGTFVIQKQYLWQKL